MAYHGGTLNGELTLKILRESSLDSVLEIAENKIMISNCKQNANKFSKFKVYS